MKIICLFGQRKCNYEGQYAPELLAAMDEYGDEENPAYLNDEEEKYVGYKDFDFMKRIIINVDGKAFDEVFFGKELDGTIVEEVK